MKYEFINFRYLSSIEWPEEFLPKYCYGIVYFLSPETANILFDAFEKTLKSCYVWIEDVYITGVLAEISDVKISSLNRWVHMTPPNKSSDFIVAHSSQYSPLERKNLWHSYFD